MLLLYQLIIEMRPVKLCHLFAISAVDFIHLDGTLIFSWQIIVF